MTEPKVLHLCMGSACHQHKVYDVLPKLEALMKKHKLDGVVEMKGAFCLGLCTQAVVLKLGERLFTNITPQNVEEKFCQEILPALKTQE